jgi:hypothetical protein
VFTTGRNQLVSVLSQINPAQKFTLYFFKAEVNIILPSTLKSSKYVSSFQAFLQTFLSILPQLNLPMKQLIGQTSRSRRARRKTLTDAINRTTHGPGDLYSGGFMCPSRGNCRPPRPLHSARWFHRISEKRVTQIGGL